MSGSAAATEIPRNELLRKLFFGEQVSTQILIGYVERNSCDRPSCPQSLCGRRWHLLQPKITVEPAGGAEGCRQEYEDDNYEDALARILVRELLHC